MRKNPGRPGLQTAMSPGNKWHVLGAGAVGQLFAHHLRRAGAEVVLLLRTEAALRSFQDARQCIKVERQIATEAPESTACDGAASDRRPSPGEANPGPNTSGPPAATPGAQHIDRTCNQALDLRTETQVHQKCTFP